LKVSSRLAFLLFTLREAVAQFRGGSISWEPVSFSPGDNIVRFTVRTTWVRSMGTFKKVVDGRARPSPSYQPVKGDVVKVSGRESPKFLTSTGEPFMLEVKVTANTEAEPKTNLPHECPHWSFGSTNWFDGTTEYLVSFPRTDVVDVAELQGCCRDKIKCDKEKDPWDPVTSTTRCENYNERDSR
jgi:hypothetical protein